MLDARWLEGREADKLNADQTLRTILGLSSSS
jgi:hypothetical protein